MIRLESLEKFFCSRICFWAEENESEAEMPEEHGSRKTVLSRMPKGLIDP